MIKYKKLFLGAILFTGLLASCGISPIITPYKESLVSENLKLLVSRTNFSIFEYTTEDGHRLIINSSGGVIELFDGKD